MTRLKADSDGDGSRLSVSPDVLPPEEGLTGQPLFYEFHAIQANGQIEAPQRLFRIHVSQVRNQLKSSCYFQSFFNFPVSRLFPFSLNLRVRSLYIVSLRTFFLRTLTRIFPAPLHHQLFNDARHPPRMSSEALRVKAQPHLSNGSMQSVTDRSPLFRLHLVNQ